MKIQRLTLQKFTAFEDAAMEFCPGVNVFVGANGTGKSHVLKILYCLLKANAPDRNGSLSQTGDFETRVKEKISRVFRPVGDGLGRLVNRRPGRETARINLTADAGESVVRLTQPGNLYCDNNTLGTHEAAIFVPSREVLSICYSLRTAYEEVQLNFDETYYDLARMLMKPPLRGPRGERAAQMVQPLETIIRGRVYEENGVFYVNGDEGLIEAHLLAEGWRKIASLCRLIVNGSLSDKGFLFWDEPEANLNPNLVKPVCEMLQRLAADGVQVFVSTHDYLISNELSLAAEYPTQQPRGLRCDLRFFALNREPDGGVTVETGDTLSQLRHNDILAEFAAHYDREHDLLDRTLNADRTGVARP